MAQAAHTSSATSHLGTLQGSGVPTVVIGGLPAAVMLDPSATIHSCGRTSPPPDPPGPVSIQGSQTVFIGGKPAARVGDAMGCGASVVLGSTTVLIGD